jgi:hypothetical protein
MGKTRIIRGEEGFPCVRIYLPPGIYNTVFLNGAFTVGFG